LAQRSEIVLVAPNQDEDNQNTSTTQSTSTMLFESLGVSVRPTDAASRKSSSTSAPVLSTTTSTKDCKVDPEMTMKEMSSTESLELNPIHGEDDHNRSNSDTSQVLHGSLATRGTTVVGEVTTGSLGDLQKSIPAHYQKEPFSPPEVLAMYAAPYNMIVRLQEPTENLKDPGFPFPPPRRYGGGE